MKVAYKQITKTIAKIAHCSPRLADLIADEMWLEGMICTADPEDDVEDKTIMLIDATPEQIASMRTRAIMNLVE